MKIKQIVLEVGDKIELIISDTGIRVPVTVTLAGVDGIVRIPEYRGGYGYYESHFGVPFEAARSMLRGHPLRDHPGESK